MYLLAPIEISDSGSSVVHYGSFRPGDSGNYVLYQKQYSTGSAFIFNIRIVWTSESEDGGIYTHDAAVAGLPNGSFTSAGAGVALYYVGSEPIVNINNQGLFRVILSGSGDSPRTYIYSIEIINTILS